MAYAVLKNEPELLKLITRDDQIKIIKHPVERHDFENIF